MTLICNRCGAAFEPRSNRQRYCSASCRRVASNDFRQQRRQVTGRSGKLPENLGQAPMPMVFKAPAETDTRWDEYDRNRPGVRRNRDDPASGDYQQEYQDGYVPCDWTDWREPADVTNEAIIMLSSAQLKARERVALGLPEVFEPHYLYGYELHEDRLILVPVAIRSNCRPNSSQAVAEPELADLRSVKQAA